MTVTWAITINRKSLGKRQRLHSDKVSLRLMKIDACWELTATAVERTHIPESASATTTASWTTWSATTTTTSAAAAATSSTKPASTATSSKT